MPRRADHHFAMPDGKLVGYGLFRHRGIYHVRYQAPAGEGYRRASTNCTTINDAHVEAAKIVLKAYGPHAIDPRRLTWADVVKELKASTGMRPDTLSDYLKTIRVFQATIPGLKGPSEVTPELAQRFKRLFASTTYKRGKASDAAEYQRSATTVAGYLRKLSSLWAKHFKELGYVTSNPWEGVSRPPVEKKLKHVPSADEFNHFLQWLEERYPGWALVRLWVQVKAVAGCRTLDLCLLTSSCLRDGRLVFPAAVKKERADRPVWLPPSLVDELKAIAGPTWLWEKYTEDAKTYRPNNKNRSEFDPRTLSSAMSNIFREYNEAHPDRTRLTPHGLKRRALTLGAMLTQSVKAAANAIGTTAHTADKYYIAANQAFDADKVFELLARAILPHMAPAPAAEPGSPT